MSRTRLGTNLVSVQLYTNPVPRGRPTRDYNESRRERAGVRRRTKVFPQVRFGTRGRG